MKTPIFSFCRVHEGGGSHWGRVHYHRVHWLLRETHIVRTSSPVEPKISSNSRSARVHDALLKRIILCSIPINNIIIGG